MTKFLSPDNTTICFFNTAKVWGGGEEWHFANAKELKHKGFKIIAVTAPGSELFHKYKDADIPVFEISVQTLSFLNFGKRQKLVNFFKKNRVGAVIINLSADLKIAALSAAKAGVPKIIYRRGSAIAIKAHFINKYLLYKKVTHILANSEATKKTVLQNLNLNENKVHIIYNGIKTENYKYHYKNSGTFTLGGLGRLSDEKGFHFLIDTIKILRNEGLEIKALIGGKGNLEEELKAYAIEQDLEKEIEFSGFIKDINAFMQRIDVFAMTSKWEGFGYVTAEAAACGKPAVAFNVSSNPELIANGKTGYIVKPFDTHALAQKIKLLYENNELLHNFGLNAGKRVEEKFAFSRSVKNLIDYLEK